MERSIGIDEWRNEEEEKRRTRRNADKKKKEHEPLSHTLGTSMLRRVKEGMKVEKEED